jgi:hypothetical protein
MFSPTTAPDFGYLTELFIEATLAGETDLCAECIEEGFHTAGYPCRESVERYGEALREWAEEDRLGI